MHYIILLYGPEDGPGYEELSPEAFAEAMQVHIDFTNWCADNGVTIADSLALVESKNEYVVSEDGSATDGPYLELKEQLGGYYVIATDSPELAREATKRCPNYGVNVLRPAASRD